MSLSEPIGRVVFEMLQAADVAPRSAVPPTLLSTFSYTTPWDVRLVARELTCGGRRLGG